MTMSHICNRTGLSRGGVYGHYAGTGQIFADIIQEIMGDLESGVEEKMQSGFSATRILDQLLARYQGEMLDHGGSLGLAFYEYYSALPPSADNALLSQYHASRAILRRLIQYGIRRGEFESVPVNAVVDLLLFSYQGVQMLKLIMRLDEEEIPKGMIGQIRSMLVKQTREAAR